MHDPWRPQFHYTAQRNWLNDPNGLVWFEGEYHLFYQYNPFGDQWGHMSWGHAVSADLLHWQELPVAIAEDKRASIFSGSVVVDTHNSSGFGDGLAPPLVAIYTGCLRRPEGGQAQELAYSTDHGRTWTKYAGNPVLDLGLRDFRDPKVFWHDATARWVMVVSVPDERSLAFYASPNLKDWQWLSRFDAPAQGHGIWECPDLIELPVAGEAPVWMLKVDVFEGHPSQGSGARIFFGHFDGTRFIAEPQTAPIWPDHGADFYAALSWANLPAAQQRQLWIGWMNNHRYAKLLPTQPWRGAMSVPRELSLRRSAQGLQLMQQPWRELRALRVATSEQTALRVRDPGLPVLLAKSDGRTLEIELECGHSTAQEYGLLLRMGPGEETRIGVDKQRGTVFVDRSRAGFNPVDPHFATRREAPCSAVTRLHILVDACSVEIFVNDGEIVITEQVFPSAGSRGAMLFSLGGESTFGLLRVHTLKATV